MDIKLIVLCIVSLCISQSFQTVVNDNEDRASPIDLLKELISNIEKAMHDLVRKIPTLLRNIEDKIKNVTKNAENFLAMTIEKLQDKIQDVLASAGIDISAARECRKQELQEADYLIKNVSQSIKNCKNTAEEKKQALQEQFWILQLKAKDLLHEMYTGNKDCFKDSPNFSMLIRCMFEHLEVVKPKVKALLVQIKNTIVTATSTAGQITATLIKCAGDVNKEIINGEKDLILNFKNCVEELNPKETL